MASRLLPRHSLLEDKYLIGEPIGMGGMGAVFEAKHTLLDKKVAIKVMIGEDEEGTQRLIREARAASGTGHPNITSVTDMGRTPQGSLFVVMEFLDGQTIKGLMSKGPLPYELALRLVEQVLAGLEAVHRRGIVHRDLKPDNLMVVIDDEGMEAVKILDFGISKVLKDDGSEQGLTQTGFVMGTPLYMAPEQARGDNANVGPATDLYAVGAILYAMLTGQPPHTADTLAALISAKLEQQVVPPSKRIAGLPAGLDTLVMCALENTPEKRFSDARSMRHEVLKLLGEDPSLLPRPTNPAVPLAPSRAEKAPIAPLNLDEGLDALDAATLDEEFDALDSLNLDDALVPLDVPKERAPKKPKPQPKKPKPQQKKPKPEANNLFAPPEDEDSGSGGLELALEEPQQTFSAPSQREKAEPSPRTPPPQRAPGTPYGGQARRRSHLPLLTFIALLGLGGGGAYYYFKVMKKTETTVPEVGDEVTIQFITTPRGAQVLVDGYALTSPRLELGASDRIYHVEVRATGFETKSVTFQPRTDLVLRVDLARTTYQPPKRLKKHGRRKGPER